MFTATITKEPGSSVKLSVVVESEAMEKHRGAAIAALGSRVSIDGFRPGHIPEKVLVERVGEMALLSEMAERVIRDIYPKVLEDQKIDAIGYPTIAITKLAPHNPLEFTATVAVMPVITLPNYKVVAKGVNASRETIEVTDADLTKEIENIMRQKATYERLQAKAAHIHDEHCDHTHEEETSTDDSPDTPLPALTDEYVATLGQPGQFTSVEDFKTKLREHLTIERARTVESAHRAKLTETIIAESTFELPTVLIDSEIDQMFAQMRTDLEQSNLKMEDYLAHIKKTESDLRTEWTPAAEKRARTQLILNEIAKREDVKPDQIQLDAQVAQLKAQYKEADEHRIRIYVATMMMNEGVMKLLEDQK